MISMQDTFPGMGLTSSSDLVCCKDVNVDLKFKEITYVRRGCSKESALRAFRSLIAEDEELARCSDMAVVKDNGDKLNR